MAGGGGGGGAGAGAAQRPRSTGGCKHVPQCYPTACFDGKTYFECGAVEQGEPAAAKVATTSAGSSSKPATVPAISVRRSTLLRPAKRIKTEGGASAPLPLGVSASLPPANSHACAIDLDDDSDLECTGVLTLEQRDVQAKASAAATGALVVIEDNAPHADVAAREEADYEMSIWPDADGHAEAGGGAASAADGQGRHITFDVMLEVAEHDGSIDVKRGMVPLDRSMLARHAGCSAVLQVRSSTLGTCRPQTFNRSMLTLPGSGV